MAAGDMHPMNEREKTLFSGEWDLIRGRLMHCPALILLGKRQITAVKRHDMSYRKFVVEKERIPEERADAAIANERAFAEAERRRIERGWKTKQFMH